MTPSMLSAMANIEYRQPVTLGHLAEAERVTPPTMSKIVGRLEDSGLVTRTVDVADRRIQRCQPEPGWSKAHRSKQITEKRIPRPQAAKARARRGLEARRSGRGHRETLGG